MREFDQIAQYRCLREPTYWNNNYCITTIRLQDIMLIKKWRNEQIKVLRQNRLLTNKDQENYYRNIIIPSIKSDNPFIILFSYLLRQTCIGYGGLTNIDWNSSRAEISFLLDTELTLNIPRYNECFKIFLDLIKNIAFEQLNLNRLFTETYDLRPHHIVVLEESGFVLEGRLKKHTMIEGRFVDLLIHGFLKEYYYV